MLLDTNTVDLEKSHALFLDVVPELQIPTVCSISKEIPMHSEIFMINV